MADWCNECSQNVTALERQLDSSQELLRKSCEDLRTQLDEAIAALREWQEAQSILQTANAIGMRDKILARYPK
jgi:hypothetical protein